MSFVQDPVDVEHVPAANAAQEPASGIVSRYKTQVGAGTEISKWRLQRLKKIVQDALVYFEVHKQVTQALDGFAHALAIEESMRFRDYRETAALEYNVGSCLHFMREFTQAIEWYQRSLHSLRRTHARWIGPLLFGDPTRTRELLTVYRTRQAQAGLMPNQKLTIVPKPPKHVPLGRAEDFDEEGNAKSSTMDVEVRGVRGVRTPKQKQKQKRTQTQTQTQKQQQTHAQKQRRRQQQPLSPVASSATSEMEETSPLAGVESAAPAGGLRGWRLFSWLNPHESGVSYTTAEVTPADGEDDEEEAGEADEEVAADADDARDIESAALVGMSEKRRGKMKQVAEEVYTEDDDDHDDEDEEEDDAYDDAQEGELEGEEAAAAASAVGRALPTRGCDRPDPRRQRRR